MMLKNKAILVLGVIMALGLLSACAPGGNDLTGTPGEYGTTQPQTNEPIGSPVYTTEPTSAAATQVAPTTEMTAVPLMTATSEGVATTVPGTELPSLTTTPATTGEPILIESDDLLGFEIVDSTDNVVGKVDEVLVDEA